MASTVAIETVDARRAVGGIDRFRVRAEQAPFRLARPGASRGRIGLFAGIALIAAVAAVSSLPWEVEAGHDAPEPARTGSEPPPPSQPTAAAGEATSAWVEVNHPIQLFDLTGSAFGRLPLVYRARRRDDGSERQDLLVYGAFGREGPALALSILRHSREPDAAPFFVEVARLAADQGLAVLRSGLPTLVGTRFGGFETADVTVEQGATAQPCLGFRLQTVPEGAVPVALAGLACGTNAKPMDREGLACVLDRIDLVSAGDDTDLRTFFVGAERRRGQGCGGSHLLAAGSRQTWLDGEAIQPPLKPSSAAAKASKRTGPRAPEL